MSITAIVINFVPCSPAPANGYNIKYRIAGSGDPYTDAGNFSSPPASITVDFPDGTAFEGIIKGDCGDGLFGPDVAWTAGGGDVGGVTMALIGPCVSGSPNASFQISGLNPSDVVTVRASFGGVMQKILNFFTRADLSINSPDGTPGSASSPCFSDTSPHGFTITADCVITAVGPTANVTVIAVVNNSSDSTTSCSVVIIDINGTPVNIPVIGCKGNSSTGGTPC